MNPNHAAAEAAIELINRIVPQHADTIAPFIHRLFAALDEGHAYLPISAAEIETLQSMPHLVGTHGGMPLVLSENRLFLGKMWQLETELAREMVRLATVETILPDESECRQKLQNWFEGSGSRDQQYAAALALLKPFMVITGGPGTGKTTTVAKLLGLICGETLPRIALAAPTGKAAAHMARALHSASLPLMLPENIQNHLLALSGTTVHRLLGIAPPTLRPHHNPDNPLPLDILIVDEASMLDTALFLSLLQAVPSGCRVILLGDENQLPSVGAGAVLSALSQPTILDYATNEKLCRLLPEHDSRCTETPPPLAGNIARLNISHRFGDNSGLGCLARAVANGNTDLAWAQFIHFPAEIAVATPDIAQLAETVSQAQQPYWQAVHRQDIEQAFAMLSEAVVLTTTREDAQQFNDYYRRHLTQYGTITPTGSHFSGQPIMIRQNDYNLGLFNGDIGIIMHDENNTPTAWFATGGSMRSFSTGLLPPHDTAFAMTVHKSQGSEYRAVWLYAPSNASVENGLNRALLYTAITRARKHFTFCGSKPTFQAACCTTDSRRSGLKNQLAAQWAAAAQP